MTRWELLHGDCRTVMANMGDNTVDSVCTDPPYHLTSIVKRFGPANSAPAQYGTDGAYARASRGFMGQTWDGGDVAFDPSLWAEVLRVLKPGGHLLAFSGSRTYHRMACAIEDSGFEIRDMIEWIYGSGFPKSLDISKAIDKAAGAEREVVAPGERSAVRPRVEGQSQGKAYRLNGDASITAPATDDARQWQGWGTALKPAHEPIVMARKPLSGTVADTVLTHGTGGLNIDSCRVGHVSGRFPANVIHDGSDEVVAGFPDSNGSGPARTLNRSAKPEQRGWGMNKNMPDGAILADAGTGSAARFFYCAKASKSDRGEDNEHPTVKPEALMRYLARLVTPPGGLIFDPFTGSGSTGKAAMLEGFRFLGAELTAEYIPIARARIAAAAAGD